MMSAVCPRCDKLDEEQFQALKEYIEEWPMAGIHEVSEATGVSPKRILAFIKEGRLEVTEGLHGELRCANCGVVIAKGNFCDSCTGKIAREYADTFAPGEAPKEVEHVARINRKGISMHTREATERRRQ
jgi:phage FluMu protein Com